MDGQRTIRNASHNALYNWVSEVAIPVIRLYIDLHYLARSAAYNHRGGVFRVCEFISIKHGSWSDILIY